jgi:CheY-like chemotaxis protein
MRREALTTERILLVEDNDEVREVAIMLLDQLGYQVVPVEGGAAALDALASDESFDLVFSDIVMPGEPDGIELAKLVQKNYPAIRILLTTGYAQAEGGAAGIPILRKPYRLNTLDRALRDALESRPSLS